MNMFYIYYFTMITLLFSHYLQALKHLHTLFNRNLNRMFSLCLRGSKCLIDLRRHIRVCKIF